MAIKLTKANINKLLKARKVINAQRANKAKVRAQFEKTDYNQMQTKFDEHLWNREVALQELGFASHADFQKFNDDMCLEELKGYIKIVSYCDHCGEGKDICTSCGMISDWKGSQEEIDKFWWWILSIIRMLKYSDDMTTIVSVPDEVAKTTKLYSGMKVSDAANFTICPEGHGFQYQYNRPLQFDISWR